MVFSENVAVKKYLLHDYKGREKLIIHSKKSTMENELYCLRKFSRNGTNPYSPDIIEVGTDYYVMKYYSVKLGARNNYRKLRGLRRILFSISKEELFRQLDEIVDILKEEEIQHFDIHPANILFCEKDKHLKLIDFCCAKTDHIIPNRITELVIREAKYGGDSGTVAMIKKYIDKALIPIEKQVEEVNGLLDIVGKKHFPGSSGLGKTYQKIDIPYFYDRPFHKDTSKEFNAIRSAISIMPKSVIDVGCASGYTIFNLMRMFQLDSAIAYEADPNVFNFLVKIRKYFSLKEFELINKISPDSEFKETDLVICMNVHMWLEKEFGREGSNLIISNLIKNSKEMFFQTAGRESGGQYRVKWLKNKEIIKNYLHDMGGNEVTFIGTLKKRHLFKVTNVS